MFAIHGKMVYVFKFVLDLVLHCCTESKNLSMLDAKWIFFNNHENIHNLIKWSTACKWKRIIKPNILQYLHTFAIGTIFFAGDNFIFYFGHAKKNHLWNSEWPQAQAINHIIKRCWNGNACFLVVHSFCLVFSSNEIKFSIFFYSECIESKRIKFAYERRADVKIWSIKRDL